MTAIINEHGLRARLKRLSGRTAVLAIVLAGCSFAAPAAAGAANQPSDDEQSVSLHVSAGLRGVTAPGSSTTAILTVENGTDSELSAGQVQVEINSTPLADEVALSGWLDDSEAAGDFEAIGSDKTSAIDAGTAETTTVFVPEDTLKDFAPGVYPLRAELTGASQQDTSDIVATKATSVLVVAESQSTQIGVLVPITAAPAGGALLSSDELSTLTALDGALTAQLAGVAGTTAVLAIDPAILTSIRVLGSSAPETAQDWLDRFESLPNERFALQFGDADVAAQAQASLPTLLEPTTLSPFIDAANFPQAPATVTPTASPSTTTSAEPTPTPTEISAVPSEEELLAVAGAIPQIVWPDGALTQNDVVAFSSYLGEGTATILSSSTVGGQNAAHAVVDGEELLVTDTAASDALSEVAAETDQVKRQRLLAESAALLVMAEKRAPGAPLLVGLDRDEDRSADALRDAVSAADSIGFTLSALRDTPLAAATVTAEADPARAAAVINLLSDEGTLSAFSSILTDSQVLLSPERMRIMRTLAVGASSAEFAERVQTHQTRTTDTLAAVSIPPSSTIQLLTANADLPIAVRNDLPWPVTVQLFASPSDPRLDVQPFVEAVVQANSTTRVKVPVSARVGSGELDLRLSLYSPTGVQIQDEQIVRVAVRAEWEAIGLFVFGGLVVLLIGLGVFRTIRRKRRDSAEEVAIEDPASTAPAKDPNE